MASISGVSGVTVWRQKKHTFRVKMKWQKWKGEVYFCFWPPYTHWQCWKKKCHDTLFPYAKIQWPGQAPDHIPAAHGMPWLSCKWDIHVLLSVHIMSSRKLEETAPFSNRIWNLVPTLGGPARNFLSGKITGFWYPLLIVLEPLYLPKFELNTFRNLS